MEAGKLRHIIDIQQQSTTQDSYGEAVDTWTNLYSSVYASIEDMKAREFYSGEKLNSEITHKIRIRYKASILPKMRVKFGTRYFNIETIVNWQERNIFLDIMCKELI